MTTAEVTNSKSCELEFLFEEVDNELVVESNTEFVVESCVVLVNAELEDVEDFDAETEVPV